MNRVKVIDKVSYWMRSISQQVATYTECRAENPGWFLIVILTMDWNPTEKKKKIHKKTNTNVGLIIEHKYQWI